MCTTRLRKRVTGSCIALLVIVLATVGWRRRKTAQDVAELRQVATTRREGTFSEEDLEGLPTPVYAYLDTVLQEGQPYIDSVYLEQTGKLRPGDAASPWKPFAATQYVTVDPPGFVWDASVSLAPFVSVRVRDQFHDWAGTANVSLFGVVPLEGDDSSSELDEAALMRYLAEAVWYPTALLPTAGVEWESIDKRTAKATIENGDVSASVTFSFTENNEVAHVSADRYRHVDGGYEVTPWSGYWRNYETRNGVRVPTAGDVVWHLRDGDMHAWTGHVTKLRYNEL
ncbi:hypothetical protein E2L06_16690 [Haloterrigena sp. H1]|uniref:DUF6544 family protein n=1 Tax=Haloterrigena sp. H1 TaxID=2552943 RepID=UPI00110EC69A|nr:DUF6544 family protein [Haloterrigena sp. H1]TMT81591.1 hypothetical protein E2L06_16690 [Haloterrigena sp. H1]